MDAVMPSGRVRMRAGCRCDSAGQTVPTKKRHGKGGKVDPTARATIGKTGLEVTRLGLGTAPLGGFTAPIATAGGERIIAAAYEEGIRFFDTAPFYGHGRVEEMVGRVLGSHPRGSYALASKVGYLLRRGAAPHTLQWDPSFDRYRKLYPIYDYSAEGVRRSHAESLARLGLDAIDILHVHDCEEFIDQALREAFPALAALRAEGAIKAVSTGLNDATVLARVAREADVDCVLLANTYSLLDQTALLDALPTCARRGISVIVGGVFNGGVLANPQSGASYSAFPPPPGALERARAVEAVCRAHGVPLVAAAIQFPLGHPTVASVIIGARTVAELENNVRMFRHPIPASLWSDLRAEGLILPEAPVPPGAA
jgi:D-threo-aldose 1-dehydrogenase